MIELSNIGTTMAGKGKKAVKAETILIMQFRNNYYVGLTEGDPTHYLTDTQKKWLETIQKCQNSVKIFTNQQHADQVNPVFNKPGNFIVNVFFTEADIPNTGTKLADAAVHQQLASQGVFAPEKDDKNTNVDEERQYTKFRVIVSQVPFLKANGELEIRKVITTCAPNLMNSSPEDEKRFVKNGKLDLKEYEQACNEIAALIVSAAKDSSMDPLDVAEFGLGVYLNAFNNNPAQKEIARACMYKAFASAAKSQGIAVNWLIYEGSDPNRAKEQAEALNKKYNFDSVHFKAGDIMKSQNSLNNGSDRTVGGKSNHVNPSTTEEQLGQCSFLMEIQTTLNPLLKNSFDKINTLVDVKHLLSQKKLDGYSIKPDMRNQTVQLFISNPEQARTLQEKMTEKNILPLARTTENKESVVTLSKKDFDSLYGQGTYDNMILNTFMQKHNLYPTEKNLDYWASQTFRVGSFGGKKYTLGDKSWQIPHSVYEIMHAAQTKPSGELVTFIAETAAKKENSSYRREATKYMLNDAVQLSPQNIPLPHGTHAQEKSAVNSAEKSNATRKFKNAIQDLKEVHPSQENEQTKQYSHEVILRKQ